jgi:uncharacterized damage-inducible protein DinB
MPNPMQDQQELATARKQLSEAYERETATTLRVLRAYPEAESGLRPHPRSKTARELAWMFTCELGLVAGALQGTLDLARGVQPAPDTMADIVASFEHARTGALRLIMEATDAQLAGTTRFFTAPKTMDDVPNVPFLWFLLHDQIHHRGQLSVYLRMAGGKVPSIYGPSADEPWT